MGRDATAGVPMADENTHQEDLSAVLMEQLRAERELASRLADFKGQWVAVRDHQVAASAPTLDDLLAKIDVEDVDAVFEVAEVEGAAWFF